MSRWFGATLFASAFLLFAVQPLAAKMLLPTYGGTPAVWNTCLVFFQALLLSGYAYAHLLSERVPIRRQPLLHGILVVSAVLLTPALQYAAPLAGRLTPAGSTNPISWVLIVLLLSVGVPFFVLSATAPLLQRWLAASSHPSAKDPYYLYAASNLGSMLALLSYPFLWEPNLRLQSQAAAWIAGYVLFAAMMAGCVAAARRTMVATAAPVTDIADVAAPTVRRRLQWLALAFVPASLLYGVTTYISTDVAAVPLLWVLPLALYLLTFILMFAQRPWPRQQTLLKAFPLAVLGQTFFFAIQDLRPLWLLLGLHLLVFFLVALTCHGELARLRPAAGYLTEFYLWLSLGGVLAGVFNTILAPQIFDALLEYPLVMITACLLLPLAPQPAKVKLEWLDVWLPMCLFLLLASFIPVVRANVDDLALRASLLYGLPAAICYLFLNHPVRFALGVAALLLAGGVNTDDARGQLVDRARSFFGILRVVDVKDQDDPAVTFRRFVHGSTLHGMQRIDEGHERAPLTYYYHNGPIGQLFEAFAGPEAKQRVAVLGLGAGTLATYAESGQTWTFFEIDPEVVRVAWEDFTFLKDAAARGVAVHVVLGDGRLALGQVPDANFDLLFADAFSSDAVPVHLLTREAVQLYISKLAAHGVLVVNVTNRCLDLEPVVAGLAEELSLTARIREESPATLTSEDKKQGKAPSRWIVLARQPADLGGLVDDIRWRPLRPQAGVAVWSDDYSNLLSVFRWWPREWRGTFGK